MRKAHNKRIELTTKAEPIFSKFKVLGGFCVSSSLTFANENEKMNDLMKALMSVSAAELMATGKCIVADNDFSDDNLNVKFAELRRKYPAYDAICREIQNNGEPLIEESMLHACGMEMILRVLITIAEKRDCEPEN